MVQLYTVIVETAKNRWRAETEAESEARAVNNVRHRFCNWQFGKEISFPRLAAVGIYFYIRQPVAAQLSLFV